MEHQTAIEQAQTAALQGQNTLAQKILKSILQQDPKHVEAWLLMADVIGNPDRARQCLERVLKLDPGNSAATLKLTALEPPPGPFADLFAFTQGEDDSPQIETDSEPEWQYSPSLYGESTGPEASFHDEPTQNFQFDAPIQDAPEPGDQQGQAQKPVKRKVKKTPPPQKKSNRWVEISLIVLIVMCLCVVVVIAIGQSGALGNIEPTPTTESPLVVIYENLNAANAEDLDRYMETIHPSSIGRSFTRSTLEDLNQKYDLRYSVSAVKILSQAEDETEVSMILTTQKIRGPAFRDNRISIIMKLRLSNGVWKIYGQEVLETQYLD